MYGSMEDSGGLIQRVPPGRYPVVLILGDFGGARGNEAYSYTTVAAARLVIRDEPVVSWEMAVYDGQDVGRLGDDEFYGYPVDGGTGGFVDVQNIAALCADYDDYIERLLVDFGDSDHDSTEPVIVTNAESEPVVVAFTSGGGDGRYPTWVGRTAGGEVACVLTDFFQLPEEGDEEPGEPPREDHLDPAGFAQGNEMRVGQTLRRQSLTSSSGRYTLVHQDDGNLVLYHNAQLRPLWASGTDGTRASICTLREDAGLVLVDGDGRRVWSSGMAGRPAARLVVRDDGDIVIEDSTGTVVWSSGTAEARAPEGPVAIGDRMLPGQTLGRQSLTSPSGRTTLVHQDDGNLVIYDNDGRGAVWSSGTQGRYTARCVLHPDGDLALYDRRGHVVWSTDTAGHPESFLTVEDDGIALRAPDGTVLWRVATSTNPQRVPSRGCPRRRRGHRHWPAR
jgi:hypothetical protein